MDLGVIAPFDRQSAEWERVLTAQAKVHDRPPFDRLRSIPGGGQLLAPTLVSEIHDIRRLDDVGQFLSEARSVRGSTEPAGQRTGTSNRKMGHAPLKGAFSATAWLRVRQVPEAQACVARKEKTQGRAKALALPAAKRGRAGSVMLRRGVPRDQEAFRRP